MSCRPINEFINAQERLEEAMARLQAALERLAELAENRDDDNDEELAAEA